MKILVSLFVVVLILFSSYSIYLYLSKYKNMDEKLFSMERERSALLSRMAAVENIKNEDTLISKINSPLTPYGREIVDSLELQVSNIIMEVDSQTFIGATVEIPLDNFFDPESITVWRRGGKDLLKRIGDIINRSGNVKVMFSVYVDSYIPAEAEIYAIKTPWEIAAKRGLDIVHFLNDSCGLQTADITLEIYGNQFPKGDTTTREGRVATRRVVFTLLEK